MSRHRLIDRRAGRDAKRALELRLLREEMGDEAFDKMIAGHDDRPFKIFAIIAMVIFGAVVFAITALGL